MFTLVPATDCWETILPVLAIRIEIQVWDTGGLLSSLPVGSRDVDVEVDATITTINSFLRL